MTDAICTICSRNFLAQARALTDSYLRYHPGGLVYVLLIDNPSGFFDPAKERFTALDVRDLPTPGTKDMADRYNIYEFATAVKPFLFQYLFSRGIDRVCYFDPDIYFFSRADEILEALRSSAIVLTPHLLSPLPRGDISDDVEKHSINTGVYNFGFLGLRKSEPAEGFLNWWGHKTFRWCYLKPPALFVDQFWGDPVPAMFDLVRIIRNPGYNVAWWNLPSRPVRRVPGGYTCGGSPLKFFHFSGFDPNGQTITKKFLWPDKLAGFLPNDDHLMVAGEYRAALLKAGYNTCVKWGYDYRGHVSSLRIPNKT